MYTLWRKIKKNKIDKRWADKKSGYQNFLSDVGERPSPKHFLVRKNLRNEWSQSNCKWTLICPLNKRKDHFLFHEGRKFTRAELAKRAGVTSGTFNTRLRRGWSVSEAIQGTRADRV
jgi:hypothetical protein